ncbi:Type I transmembrane sorting receptor [Podila epicladia]|nr:Type I transmembrane sorting receptor [Podila epicladia]KAG0082947.1 Type I transmembrane sorting receptor [Podila epicladia]
MKSVLSISLTFAALTLTSASPMNFKRASATQGPIAIPLKRLNIGAPDAESGFKALAVDPVSLHSQTDQGSQDTWVVSPACTSIACQGRAPFNPATSSSVEKEFWNFAYTFGEGDIVSGDIYTDVVTVSGSTVAHQSFGVATSLLTPHSVIHGDGILGLPATDRSNPSFLDSFFDNAFEGGSLTEYIFSLYLPKNGAGELLLGGFNATKFTGSLTYLPVEPHSLWQVALDDVLYRDRSLGISLTATLSTVTSLIQLDRQSVNTLYAAIPGANRISPTRWSIPCNQVSDFTITMGGVAFKIPGPSISQGPVSVGSTQCLSAIAGGEKKGQATLGTAFLENYYTVFNKANTPFRLGFAAIV